MPRHLLTRVGLFLAALVATLGAAALAERQTSRVPAPLFVQPIDREYTKRILDNTPDHRTLTELVNHMPVSSTVPSPLSFLGYVPGENNRVTYHKDIVRYLQALDRASERVVEWEIGKSEEGRPMVAVAIADEATIAAFDKFKTITAQLTDPRKLTDGQARQLIQNGKPIYYVTGAIHATELGSPEMLMELAFRLAVEETPFIQQIRNDIIVVITPVTEVDGHERQVDNRRAQEAGQSPPGMIYWGRYVQHDNNRDGIGKGLALSRNMLESFLDLHPQVLHDLHESVTLLYTSTGTGPYNPVVAPIQTNEWWWLAETEIMEMTRRGVPGVWTYNYYDGWVPNYMFWIGVTHNSIGRFYETQWYSGNSGSAAAGRGASPLDGGLSTARSDSGRLALPNAIAATAAVAPGTPGAEMIGSEAPASAPIGGRGRTVVGAGQSREWYRPNPVPPEGIQWSGRSNINIQQSALLIAMNAVARNKEMFLENYYAKNKSVIEKGRTRAPFAYVVPAAQRRAVEAADLMNLIRREGAEVHVATEPFSIGSTAVAKGDYVIRLDQPYGGIVETLLGVQWYPSENQRPYDDTGWDIPAVRNLQTIRIDERSIFDKPMALAAVDFNVIGAIHGTGATLIVDHTTDNTLATFRFRHATVRMSAAEHGFDLAGHHFAAGAFVIRDADVASLRPTIRELGLSAWATDQMPDVGIHDLDVPRIGYMHTWTSTQDEGWTRLALDALKIPYHYFGDNLARRGGLRAKYDVLIYPHAPMIQTESTGLPAGPLVPYRTTALTPNLSGAPDASDDTRGGLGQDGLRELARFVSEGGLLIAEGATASLFTEFEITTDVSRDEPGDLLAQGSVLKTLLHDKSSPVLYGYDQDALAVMFRNSPLFRVSSSSGDGALPRRPAPPSTVLAPPSLTPMAAPPRLTTLAGPLLPLVSEPPGGRESAVHDRPGTAGATAGASTPPARGAAAFGVAGIVGAPRVLLQYPDDPNDLLLSGELAGAAHLAGRPVLIDLPIGKGHVLMFACRPFWRYQTQGDFFLALNAMLNWNDLSVGR
ncbi:MAG: M14 family zinc carboxypeptidase [Acidobacteriota bacterium]